MKWEANKAAGKRHLARVTELPCRVCKQHGVQAHHPRIANISGMGQRASDWLAFPLCRADHADLHANVPLWEMRYGRQIDHATATLEELYG